ncbi:hypothetical protein FB451DRAFT_59396 [Mycena latifolia]|nr:hypothetical protein FB451DRAFT_59396 [Mycena latifolia]
MSSLLSLPNEVLLVVFCHLEDPYPLYPLSTLCRRLHFLTLPLYLSRRGVWDDSCCNISIDAEQVDALPALQTSLFLSSVENLCCVFSNPYSQNKDLARFHRVCCMLTSIGTAKLQFGAPLYGDYAGTTQETYFIPIVDVLNKVLEKSCTALTVDAVPREPPAATAGGRHLKISKRARGTRQVLEVGVLTSSISLSPTALRQRTLSTFRLHSEILCAPHCRAWTLDVLNSFPLTSLSIDTPSVPPDVLDKLLSQTEIPTLSELSLVNCKIAPARLHHFLARHPSVTSLYLDTVFVPSGEERLPPNYLPRLTTLSAAAPQIGYLLHAMPYTAALRTVRVCSHMTHVDLVLTDTSLCPVAPRLAPPIALSLVLPVPTNLPRLIPDVDAVFDADSALHFVSTLEFVFADGEGAPAFANYAAIAKWAAPFPALRTVELVGCNVSADTAPILAAFQARAPGVERVVCRMI